MHRLRNRLRKTWIRDVLVAYRHWGMRSNDVILASYPKSGTTWLTFMLAQLAWKMGREQSLIDNRFLPGIGYQNLAEKTLPNGGRLVRSHERYRASYDKAIYVLRDGRDVAVSLYWQIQRTQGMVAEFSDYLDLFLRGEACSYGKWSTHVLGWLDSPTAARGEVLVVRYEDMKSDPHVQLIKSAHFLGLDVDESDVADAIDAGSFDSMRRTEKKTQGVAHLESGERIAVVRKGQVGDWRNYFSEADAERFAASERAAMTRMGYEL